MAGRLHSTHCSTWICMLIWKCTMKKLDSFIGNEVTEKWMRKEQWHSQGILVCHNDRPNELFPDIYSDRTLKYSIKVMGYTKIFRGMITVLVNISILTCSWSVSVMKSILNDYWEPCLNYVGCRMSSFIIHQKCFTAEFSQLYR